MNGLEAAALVVIALAAVIAWHLNRNYTYDPPEEYIERDWHWPTRTGQNRRET